MTSCDSFVWNQTTKVRCFTCGVPRGEHIGGYISTKPSDPYLDAYLSQPCDECDRSASENGVSKATGERGQFCSSHVDYNQRTFCRND